MKSNGGQRKISIKYIVVAAMLGMVMMFSACGMDSLIAGDGGATDSVEGDISDSVESEDAPMATMGNPWVEVDNDTIAAKIGTGFGIPEGADNIIWSWNETIQYAQMLFEQNGVEWNARMVKTEGFEDISGLYYTWDTETASNISDTQGIIRYGTEEENVVTCGLWYDPDKKLMYCLSCIFETYPPISIADEVFGFEGAGESQEATDDILENAPDETGKDADEPYEPDIQFSSYDRTNNCDIDETVFKDYKLTMVNFWEPWCGPCVGEMPELEELYEELVTSGEVNIIGVYDTEDGVEDVLSSCGTTYPIVKYVPAFDELQSGYVPNTVFFDSKGHIVYSSGADEADFLYIGSRDKASWSNLIEELLKLCD